MFCLQTWEHRRFAKSRLAGLHNCRQTGKAELMVPCRGLDVGLEDNLHRLMSQDYDDYRVSFIVESAADPVHSLIGRARAAHPEIDSRVVYAGKSAWSGQKVHNLRAAAAEIDDDVEFVAFVDSDARPRPEWLRAMLANLSAPGVGAVTGYRWFVPERASVANHLLYGINCNAALLLGNKAPNFVWGGSWAIRRETFERLDIPKAWNGTLSDDLVASRELRRAGLRVAFEPAAMVESPLDHSLSGMASFMRRQFIIGRYYSPLFWTTGLACTTVANLALLGGLIAVGLALAVSPAAALGPAAVCGLLYAANVFRGAVRQTLALEYFPHLKETLQQARTFDVWAGPLVGLANWFALLSSVVGRHITWRGITYRIFPGGQIQLVDRDDRFDTAGLEPDEEALPDDAVIRPFEPYRKAG